ncbi:unnamed protein product [Blepharisma stoltei]|uniref:START domain-containing protein n=1 Tax=Blepharisma stoltei TaxID=1481888 RepID=A0AAU9KEH9_9CILI|nr:unnamed protein product [Blepharisma stoltei]
MEGGSALLRACNQAVKILQPRVLDLMTASREWRDLGVDKGVETKGILTDAGLQLIKATGLINQSFQRVHDELWDYQHKTEWDDICLESSLVETFDQDYRVLYQIFKCPWPISNRDFIFVQKRSFIGEDLLISSTSVPVESIPEKRGMVRADVDLTGFHLEKVEDNVSRLTYYVSVDLKGSIPLALSNKIAGKRGVFIHKLRARLGDK